MKSTSRSRRNKRPHNNEGKEHKETSFFSKENKQPFFNTANGSAVQTKLTVGQPGDKYEKEADSVANAVVDRTSKPNINGAANGIQRESLATPQEDEKLGTAEQRMEEDKLVQEKPKVQKMNGEEEEAVQMQEEEDPVQAKEEEEMVNKMEEEEESLQMMGEEEEEPVQMMEEEEPVQTKEEEEMVNKMEEEEESLQMMGEEEEEPVQMMEEEEPLQAKHKSKSGGKKTNSALSDKIKNKAGSGRKLPKPVQKEMEGHFNKDFSDVNIHTGKDAVEMNEALGAQAFTHGKDVYFNAGKYNPDATEGKRLLAHELTHVVQQNKKDSTKKASE
ncbi:DUF4157 domain-containing protein [Aquimarina gracilis]|uniref:DUF4157 domain-containing protein n=1 Tax=Aquimarina gracilis TaxID=874422 RepID=A0ABU5ZTR7_9FLAO|nr:DUF4157 domain-containing protein [Aquimarina gracilis]MEB3345414.1 DUF4157 domain-containing protein [Aquimarina gracilis]